MGPVTDDPAGVEVVVEFLDPAPTIWACFFVSGSFDPMQVSQLLGVEGKIRRAGDRVGALTAREDSWHFSTARRQSVDWSSAVQEVLGLIRPHAAELRQLCLTKGVVFRVDLCAEIYDNSRTPIGTIDRAVIAELADLGAGIDIDLYTGSTD